MFNYMRVRIVYADGTATTVVWPSSTTLEYANNFYSRFKGAILGLEILSFFTGQNECWKEAVNG